MELVTTTPNGLIPEVPPMQSYSAADEIKSLLPVSIEDPDLEVDYTKVFFPSNRNRRPGGSKNAANANIVTPDFYFKMAKHLTNVAAYLMAVRGAIRDMYISAQSLELDQADMATKIEQRFASYRSKVSAEESILYTKAFFDSMRQGNQHIITPSTRFKGGYDVLFCGIPGSATGVGAQPGPINFKKFKSDKAYPYTRDGSFEKDNAAVKAGKAAKEMAEFFFKQLFEEDVISVPSGTKRVYSDVSLDEDFTVLATGLNKIFGKHFAGASLSDALAFNGGADGAASKRAFSKYISILLVREPNKDAVSLKYSQPGADLSKDLGITPEAFMFDSDVTVSFILHIPQPLCEFITQTKGKQIPLVPLNTWVGTWSRAMLKTPKAKNIGGAKIGPDNAPRYIISASGMKAFAERRAKLGYYTEPGRTNADGIFIANNGRMNWCPKTEDLVIDNAKNYEQFMEEALQLSFDAGSPVAMTQQGVTNRVFALASPDYEKKIASIKTKLNMYAGSLQGYNWDYNCALSSAIESPDKLNVTQLAGAVAADDRSAAEYLTMPFLSAVNLMFPGMTDGKGERVSEINAYSHKPSRMRELSLFRNFSKAYAYLLFDHKVPSLQELVTAAAKELKLESLDPATATDDNNNVLYEKGLYAQWMDFHFKVSDRLIEGVEVNDTHTAQAQAIVDILAKVLDDAAGVPGSNLAHICFRAGIDLSEDPHYMSPEFFKLHDFNNVYRYLGGTIFRLAAQAMSKAGTKALLVINTDNPLPPVPFPTLSKEVMPFVTMLGNYVPDSEKILERAEEMTELTHKDDSITAEDIHLPGSSENFQMFPHQVESMQSLMRHPKYAVLDIAPGGGKTILLLTDVASLIHEGKVKRPAIICPNNLIKNWIEDMHKVTDGKWNLIPLSRETYETWGPERLGKLIESAPRNTIYVIGMRFFQVDKYPIVIGSHAEQVSGALEFIRRYEFDYIAIDESQRVKNPGTRFHQTTKQVCTASCVKYIRIASGSLIQNQLIDVVGQAAMFSSQIFRTPQEYMAANSESAGDGSKAMVLKADAEVNARNQFAKFCSVMTFKRKDWAFLLPRPIETFMSVSLDKNDGLNADGTPRDKDFVDTRLADAHQLMYDAILKTTLDEIKDDKNIMKILGKSSIKDKSESGDNDSEAEESGTDPDKEEDDLLDATGDLADDVLEELEGLLHPYLQRLEQCLTDPMGDAFGAEYFKGLETENFVSNKVVLAIKRIKLNFEKQDWVKGKTYNKRDVVDFGDTRYVLLGSEEHPLEESTDHRGIKRMSYKSETTPNNDSAWKIEPHGKVIVFCRYKRTVNAIYNALPPSLKKIAVRFHSDIPGRYKNLDAFKKDPYSTDKGVQILIANEMAISEGHNMQMASRLVRMESPWAPGELDQAQSRIFRPDPSGKFTRENVYLDWILASGTMEVAKFARLISKIISKAKFDEAHNPRYDAIKGYQIPVIRMSLDVIAAMPQMSDFMESHIEPYTIFQTIQAEEFEEMRAKRNTKMITIPQTPMFPDAKILEQVPYLPGLKIPDRHNYGLVNMAEYLDSDDPEIKKSLRQHGVKGTYVHTEMGNGTIIGTTSTRGNADNPVAINTVKVQLANGDILSGLPVSQVYAATNLTEETVKDFSPKKTWVTKRDREKLDKREKAGKIAAEKEAMRLKRQQERERQQIDRLRKLDKLKKNVRSGRRPVDEGETPRKTSKQKSEANMHIDLYPVIYNGFWSLEAVPHDEDVVSLEDFGFKKFGAYATVVVKDHNTFAAIDTWLSKKFALSADTGKRFDDLYESFQGRGKKFAASIYPAKDLKNFYTLSHRMSGVDKSTGRPTLKVYPAVFNNGLLLNVDVATNPAFKKAINAPIPGTTVKFSMMDGLHIRFFNSRSELMATIKELKAEGMIITDEKGLMEEIAEIRTKVAATK